MSDNVAPEVQAFIRQEVQRQVQDISRSLTRAGEGSFKASEYDIRVDPANIYPGDGWEYVATVAMGVNVFIIWRMSRVLQAQRGLNSIVPIGGKSA